MHLPTGPLAMSRSTSESRITWWRDLAGISRTARAQRQPRDHRKHAAGGGTALEPGLHADGFHHEDQPESNGGYRAWFLRLPGRRLDRSGRRRRRGARCSRRPRRGIGRRAHRRDHCAEVGVAPISLPAPAAANRRGAWRRSSPRAENVPRAAARPLVRCRKRLGES